MEVRVFYFMGLLGSGKTTFIDKTLNGIADGFNPLVICREVGDEDFTAEEARVIYTDKFTAEFFRDAAETYDPGIVFIEDDGTQTTDLFELEQIFPENWFIAQAVCMANAENFERYMIKAPNLLMDKIRTASMIVINRCDDALAEYLRSQNLRMSNKDAEIWLEFKDGHVEPYAGEEDSVFDLSTGKLRLTDDDFPAWYIESFDFPDRFEGIEVNVDLEVNHEEAYGGYDAAGRWLMTCCENDIRFFPVACTRGILDKFRTGDLVNITAICHSVEWDPYEGTGPLLEIKRAVQKK